VSPAAKQPDGALSSGREALLERDAELDLLRARIVELRDEGHGGVLLVEGPPGIIMKTVTVTPTGPKLVDAEFDLTVNC
jgi:hypothetical protein